MAKRKDRRHRASICKVSSTKKAFPVARRTGEIIKGGAGKIRKSKQRRKAIHCLEQPEERGVAGA